MIPTPAPVRRHWRRSQRTAEAVAPVRRFLPTHRIRDAVMSRRGLEWGIPAMLLAAPYIAAVKLLTEHIEQAGPGWGWLHLVVLLCAWNALKMLWLGPMSLIALASARHREHVQRRAARREAETHGTPDETLVMARGCIMNAVTYRYSAEENPTRLNQQEADCRRYANEHGLTIIEVFTDTGHSRHGLHHMLDAAQREDVTGLIVTDLARLGSKYADHVAVVQQLHDAGVDIHVTKDRTSDPATHFTTPR